MTVEIPKKIHKGCFLISNPEIDGGLFTRSVLLLCEHNEVGSFAIIINKPLDVELPSELIDLDNASNKNISIRAGGPVQTNQLMLLHNAPSPSQQLLSVTEDVFLGGDLEYLHELLEDEKQPQIYLCFGYSGWASSQLEREVLEGHWFICQANKKLIFETPPEELWHSLLKEMGGKYAVLSTIPEDLSLN
jgi:putative transcriptional regulator